MCEKLKIFNCHLLREIANTFNSLKYVCTVIIQDLFPRGTHTESRMTTAFSVTLPISFTSILLEYKITYKADRGFPFQMTILQ
jgi:hypothetical protein